MNCTLYTGRELGIKHIGTAQRNQQLPTCVADRPDGEFDGLILVRSGLDDTMRMAYQEIRETFRSDEKISDLRTACYVASIRKIARSYVDIGVY